ncbi:hypothetical protein RJ527_02685 [Thalassospiraceae bacterium LMO-SO8]|nr:hypothetical protein [Alphaproteobacteria bacterium LMO-S08]WND76657.1 hypothetical protein RJ527_02685 [Thalassospiraceae bacterium LMO-SO8]
MVNRNPVLNEIKDWKLEAKEEESSRYFYSVSDLQTLVDSSKCFVLGRKGTGKTAIVEHLRHSTDEKTFARILSFQHFPFNDLYALRDGGYRGTSQYITLWKYVILSAVCSMMAGENKNVQPHVSTELSQVFNLDMENSLAHSISQLISKSGGFSILGNGGDVHTESIVVPNGQPWERRVSSLIDIIKNHGGECSYYILFDALDEDFVGVLDANTDENYFSLIISLFKAIHSLRSDFKVAKSRVLPIAFLRTDIFDLLKDNDKNKWSDLSMTLDWTESSLRNLMAHRISRAHTPPSSGIIRFSAEFDAIFQSKEIRYGNFGKQKRSVFKHLLRGTLMRPRDMIAYMRACASVSIQRSENKISNASIKKATEIYSEYLRGEFNDELYSVIPYFGEILDIFSSMRKQVIRPHEFKAKYDLLVVSDGIVKLEFFDLCKALFHYGVIGNLPTQTNREIFKYNGIRVNFNINEKIIIHRGLLASLQIF